MYPKQCRSRGSWAQPRSSTPSRFIQLSRNRSATGSTSPDAPPGSAPASTPSIGNPASGSSAGRSLPPEWAVRVRQISPPVPIRSCLAGAWCGRVSEPEHTRKGYPEVIRLGGSPEGGCCGSLWMFDREGPHRGTASRPARGQARPRSPAAGLRAARVLRFPRSRSESPRSHRESVCLCRLRSPLDGGKNGHAQYPRRPHPPARERR